MGTPGIAYNPQVLATHTTTSVSVVRSLSIKWKTYSCLSFLLTLVSLLVLEMLGQQSELS